MSCRARMRSNVHTPIGHVSRIAPKKNREACVDSDQSESVRKIRGHSGGVS